MQKFGKHILTLILASLFLVSFTGIRLLIHHCTACDTSAMYVFADVRSCCDTPFIPGSENTSCSINTNESGSCCAEEKPEDSCENCCDNEVVYVKKDYEVSHERQVPRVNPVQVDAGVFSYSLLPTHLKDTCDKFLFPSTVDPPPGKVARDFILFTHQMKICSFL